MGVRGDERNKAGGCLARERQFPHRHSLCASVCQGRSREAERGEREKECQCGVWMVARFTGVANEVEMVLRFFVQ
ncbi:hypothetical protein C1H46_032111 [Malus baccata]|uniref:Uncharacterized protein n=1 Tax=Malus baccata TaxID=106549 RepID=A0A540L777_MALBA|nr:hypothetical protein C1H46_032110 [Malus baccata]TQD82338.1 hypothetical protein C1H46_032111 [Malus baccata]